MAENPSPSVAVIIAAYNAEKTIVRAIVSALAQPEVSEVWVVDDASRDSTIATAQSAEDGSGRLKLLKQSPNAGPSAARNRAIAESKAPWLTVLDADDFFLEGRIAGLLSYSTDADLIADDMYQVSCENIDGPRRRLLDDALSGPQKITFQDFVLGNVTRRRSRGELGFIKPLIRRSFLDVHQLTFQPHMRLGEDYELYTRVLALGARLVLVPAQGYVSVVRPDSLSAVHSEIDLQHLRDCDASIAMLPNLSPSDKAALREHYQSVNSRLQWRLMINAVKARSVADMLRCFGHSPRVSLYLLRQLAGEVPVRLKRKLAAKPVEQAA